jgi:hypothetical protein
MADLSFKNINCGISPEAVGILNKYQEQKQFPNRASALDSFLKQFQDGTKW